MPTVDKKISMFAKIISTSGPDKWTAPGPYELRVGETWARIATEEDLLTEAVRSFIATFKPADQPLPGAVWDVEVYMNKANEIQSVRVLASGVARLIATSDSDAALLRCTPVPIDRGEAIDVDRAAASYGAELDRREGTTAIPPAEPEEERSVGDELDALIDNLSRTIPGFNRDKSYALAAETQAFIIQVDTYRTKIDNWLHNSWKDLHHLPKYED